MFAALLCKAQHTKNVRGGAFELEERCVLRTNKGVGAGAREACSPIGRGGGWRAAFRAHVYDQELARPLFGALTLT